MNEFTVGVEEEYQLVSPETGGLISRARDVLELDWSAELHPENQQTMLEIGTHVCRSAAEVDRELRRLRLQVASTAAAADLRMVAAGIHPFSRWEAQERTRGERYERILERYGRVIRTEHIFGMHVHVAVPPGHDRARLMNGVRGYIPHLLALAASSPVYEGEDTGYASYRTIIAHRLPHTGPPPCFPSDDRFREFVGFLMETGAIEDEYTLYWSIRPHPEYPTLEFRMTDVCPRVEDAVAIAALVRALVATAAEGKLPLPGAACSESATDELLAHNEWEAARYGLDATHVDPALPGGKETLRDGIHRLLERVGPTAERLGDAEALAGIEALLARGNGAERIRAMLPECEGLAGVVQWLARESVLGVGLDRRRSQREA
ncbi:MAG TPA: YbdK family carboxylate-amine ligase [Longimicrobiaceae bacterium]|nr:YbdK family carboxylate-amine ligase [Longimicrobiaceae bacterium]